MNHAVIYRGRTRAATSAPWRSSSCTPRITSIRHWTCPCASTTEVSRRSRFLSADTQSSEQDGLTGIKGSMLRKVVLTRRARRWRARSPRSSAPSNESTRGHSADGRPHVSTSHMPRRLTPRALKWTVLLAATGLIVYFCLLIVRPFLNVMAWSSVLAITFYPCTNSSCGRRDGCH